MRISGDFSRVFGEYGKVKKVNGTGRLKRIYGEKDTMFISNQAKDYHLARKVINSIPDIREDKVRQLEEAYASGTYNVSGKDVADKLMKKLFDKKV